MNLLPIRRFLFFIVPMLCSHLLSAQLEIVVTDEQGEAISDVYIYHHSKSSHWTLAGVTNAHGILIQTLPKASQSLHLRKVGFAPLDTLIPSAGVHRFELMMRTEALSEITFEAE